MKSLIAFTVFSILALGTSTAFADEFNYSYDGEKIISITNQTQYLNDRILQTFTFIFDNPVHTATGGEFIPIEEVETPQITITIPGEFESHTLSLSEFITSLIPEEAVIEEDPMDRPAAIIEVDPYVAEALEELELCLQLTAWSPFSDNEAFESPSENPFYKSNVNLDKHQQLREIAQKYEECKARTNYSYLSEQYDNWEKERQKDLIKPDFGYSDTSDSIYTDPVTAQDIEDHAREMEAFAKTLGWIADPYEDFKGNNTQSQPAGLVCTVRPAQWDFNEESYDGPDTVMCPVYDYNSYIESLPKNENAGLQKYCEREFKKFEMRDKNWWPDSHLTGICVDMIDDLEKTIEDPFKHQTKDNCQDCKRFADGQ